MVIDPAVVEPAIESYNRIATIAPFLLPITFLLFMELAVLECIMTMLEVLL